MSETIQPQNYPKLPLHNSKINVTIKCMNYQILELLLEDGTSPYEEWFLSLDPIAAAKIAVAKLRLQQGNTSNIKWFGGIGEYKIDWGPGYRIYPAKDGPRIIVLIGGGTKKGQQMDVERAINLWKSYKRRKLAGEDKGR